MSLPHFQAADYRLGMPWVLDEGKHMDLMRIFSWIFHPKRCGFVSDCWTMLDPSPCFVSGGFEYRRNAPRTRYLGGFSHLGSWILGLKKGGSLHGFLG